MSMTISILKTKLEFANLTIVEKVLNNTCSINYFLD